MHERQTLITVFSKSYAKSASRRRYAVNGARLCPICCENGGHLRQPARPFDKESRWILADRQTAVSAVKTRTRFTTEPQR
jgi:hypothetical protein